MTKKNSLQRSRAFKHRTRTGCAICRKRKVKCDEGRPRCQRCISAKFQCPGYLGDSQSLRRLTDAAAMPITLPQLGGSKDSQELIHLLPALMDKQGIRTHYSQILPWIISLSCGYLPSRAGHHFALDAALACTASGIRELLKNGQTNDSQSPFYIPKLSTELTKEYTRAVAALRYVLDDRQLCSAPEVLLAALLICCFETLRDNSEETVRVHMYGLSKIYEHRGLPYIESQLERTLLIGCLALIIESCMLNNTPCFWSQKQWNNVLIQYRDDKRTTPRNKWFTDNWRLQAYAATVIADCSAFILYTKGGFPGYNEERRLLRVQIQRFHKIGTKLQNAKIQELCDGDTEATLFTAYEKFSKTKDDRTGYPIHYLATYVEMRIVCSILKVALGGTGALTDLENAAKVVEWLDLYVKRMPPEEFSFLGTTAGVLKATRVTLDEWRAFAKETEARAEQGKILVIEPHLFKRWLMLAEIKPRAKV